MATGMVQRPDGTWFYEDTSPAHLTYDQWLAQQGGPGATPPGPAIVVPPVLDFSAPPAQAEPTSSAQAQPVEQGPVQAKAYYASMGQEYAPTGGSSYESYSSDWTSSDTGTEEPSQPSEEQKPPKPGRQPSMAPQQQPYQPPAFNYSFDPKSPGYGGMGASGDSKSVWGASYGGVGEDPYLKAMQNIANPFKEFFAQMPLNHF